MSVPLAPPVSFPRGRESSDSAIGGWIAVVPWASGCTAASCTGAASAGVALDPGSAQRAVRDDVREKTRDVRDDIKEEVRAGRDDVEEEVRDVRDDVKEGDIEEDVLRTPLLSFPRKRESSGVALAGCIATVPIARTLTTALSAGMGSMRCTDAASVVPVDGTDDHACANGDAAMQTASTTATGRPATRSNMAHLPCVNPVVAL